VDTIDRTFTFTDHLSVEVRLASGEVTLLDGRAGEARVEVDAPPEMLETIRVEAVPTSEGTRLVVHSREDRGLLRLRGGRRARVRLTVPTGSDLVAKVATADIRAGLPLGDVAIDAATGDLQLGAVTGDLRVSTAAGDVSAADVAGTARVTTASGDVRLGAVGGDLHVKTVSGDIRAAAVGGDVGVRTVSGDAVLGELSHGAVSAVSTSGDVDLTVAVGRRVRLDVTTVSGRLHCDLDQGVGGEDGAVDLELRGRTVSGDVTIRRGSATARTGEDAAGGAPRGVTIV
jgi:hypothetical protein